MIIRKVGKVSDSDFKPIQGARVRFNREDGAFTAYADTDEQGNYSVELTIGRYRALVSHPDFINGDAFLPGYIVVSAGPQLVINFFLQQRTDSTWVHADATRDLVHNDLHFSDFFSQPRLPLVGDFDGDDLAELLYTRDRGDSAGNDFWCIKATPGEKTWHYLGRDPHRSNIAFDASTANHRAGFGVVGDFDGDGRDEVALKIDSAKSRGNDFWVMKYDPIKLQWHHLSRISGHPAAADFDCSASDAPARFAVAGDFDGDGRDEIAIGISASKSSGNDLWVMDYDPVQRRWQHLSQISGHPRGGDIDCSASDDEARFAVAGDFDGDGIDELAVAIKRTNSRGNDFWVMKFDPAAKRWRHLSPIHNHPSRADLDCGGAEAYAITAVAADFDNNGRDELVVAARRSGKELNDLWAMSFDPDAKKWSHMSRLPDHPIGADIDPSVENLNVRSLAAADVDGDGVPELIVTPDASGSRSNDLWILNFDHRKARWEHLSPENRPSNASVDMSFSSKEAGFVVAGNFGVRRPNHRAEIVASIQDTQSIANANPNFWVMRYAPKARTVTHAVGRLCLVTISAIKQIGLRLSFPPETIKIDMVFDSQAETAQVISFPPLEDEFETPFGDNTTRVKLINSSPGVFDPGPLSVEKPEFAVQR